MTLYGWTNGNHCQNEPVWLTNRPVSSKYTFFQSKRMVTGGSLWRVPCLPSSFGPQNPLITTPVGFKNHCFSLLKRTFVVSMILHGWTNANHCQHGPVWSSNLLVLSKYTFFQSKTHGYWGDHLGPSLFTTSIWATKTIDNDPRVCQKTLFFVTKTCIRGFDDFFWLNQCKPLPTWARLVNKSSCSIKIYVFPSQNAWLLGGPSARSPVNHPQLGLKTLR